jgi:hypothetical protein
MKSKAKALNWEAALLQQAPFPEVPPRSPQEARWAGMVALKAHLDRLFAVAITTSTSQVILNWGQYGSGKTHAAIYYGLDERMPKVRAPRVGEAIIITVPTPKDPSAPEVVLYREILETVQFRRIRGAVRELIDQKGDAQALISLQELMASEALGKAMWLLGHERASRGQMSLFGDSEPSEDWNRLLEAYFHSQTTKTDLKTLGLSRGVDTSQDRFRIIAGVIQCLIGFAPLDDVPGHRRFLLWIDEMEDLLYFASRQHRPFTQGIRDLIDRLPNYFTLLMNFTLASPELHEDATVLLGQAVMDRVTAEVYFKEPTPDEAFEYAVQIMQSYRTRLPEKLGLPKTFPFTEDALRWLIEILDRRTPRRINRRCGQIIMHALAEGAISAEKGKMIDRPFIDKVHADEAEAEEG